MTDEIVQSMSLNKILISILEHHGPLSVPTLQFVESTNEDKDLVVEYDDEELTFKFSLRSKNEQQ